MRRWVAVGGLGCASALCLVMSCVGGDNSGIPPGTDGGACLQNNTCNTGLVCVLQNGTGVCEPGTDGSTDGPGSDAPATSDGGSDAADSSSDAGIPCEASIDLTNPCPGYNTCYDKHDAGYLCTNSWTTQCPSAYPSGYFLALCFAQESTFPCCVQYATLAKGACAPALDLSSGTINLGTPACGPTDFVLCDASANCAVAQEAGTACGPTCTPVTLKGVPGLSGVIAGVCQ